jgi:hypothetical protein
MDYRGQGFLNVVLFGTLPLNLSPPLPVSKLDRRHRGRLRKRDNLVLGEGRVGEREGAKSYDGEKAWSSIIKGASCKN